MLEPFVEEDAALAGVFEAGIDGGANEFGDLADFVAVGAGKGKGDFESVGWRLCWLRSGHDARLVDRQ